MGDLPDERPKQLTQPSFGRDVKLGVPLRSRYNTKISLTGCYKIWEKNIFESQWKRGKGCDYKLRVEAADERIPFITFLC